MKMKSKRFWTPSGSAIATAPNGIPFFETLERKETKVFPDYLSYSWMAREIHLEAVSLIENVADMLECKLSSLYLKWDGPI